MDQFSRIGFILDREAMDRLKRARVAVFGIGGVGGYVTEGLVRSGVGALDLIDHDKIEITNLNRQIIALRDNIGRSKVDVAKERAGQINPDCRVNVHRDFFLSEEESEIDFSLFDYVVDAIDTVTGKLAIIEAAKKAGVPVISAMGTGNKVDPSALEVADIYETSVCPLARVMRRECKKRNIPALKVVYSREKPRKGDGRVPGSLVFVPAAAGMILAAEVVKDLTDI